MLEPPHSTSTHNPCFRAKLRKIMNTHENPCFIYKMGCKGSSLNGHVSMVCNKNYAYKLSTAFLFFFKCKNAPARVLDKHNKAIKINPVL